MREREDLPRFGAVRFVGVVEIKDRFGNPFRPNEGFLAPLNVIDEVLRGSIQACDRIGLTGWSQNAAFPEARVCLGVLVDAAFVCHARRNVDGLRQGRDGQVCPHSRGRPDRRGV